MDQQLAQILVAALADPEQPRLAAGGRPAAEPAQPCRKIAATVESLAPCRRLRSDAVAFSTPMPGIVVSRRASSFSSRPAYELRIECCDPPVKLLPLRAHVLDQLRIRGAEPAFPSCSSSNADQVLLELAPALWNDDAALQQDCAQLVDQRRSLADQPVARRGAGSACRAALRSSARRTASSGGSPLRRSPRRPGHRSSAP